MREFRKIRQLDEMSDPLFLALTVSAALTSTAALAFALLV